MSDSSRPPCLFPHAGDPPAAGPADLAEARQLLAQLDPAGFDEAHDPKAWLLEPAVQELIARVIDETVEPWTGVLPPDGLRALREEIEMACHTDATLIEYLDRIRPRADSKRSGKTPKGLFRKDNGVPAARKKVGGERP
jgi:hypothetical protein